MIPIFPRGLLTIVSTKDAEWDILEIFLGGLLKAFHTAYSDHRMLHRSRLQSSLPIITSRENEVKGSKTSAAVLRHDWLLQAVTDKDSTWQGGELSKSHSRAEQGILASPTRPDLEEQTEVLQSTGQWGGNISLCPAQRGSCLSDAQERKKQQKSTHIFKATPAKNLKPEVISLMSFRHYL
ncbi:uncharacterized protein LOC122160563 isoform X3 [Centrocercus urophasianus]|uniref:uncharacterized protein LOC122160563 isoform X3 n=1 Tax=Centrocercus urophasianus TaxID=9002 RepID=UPI001C653208|nr:uncharacterized protein LOC122160563 isoform X3 [Centrocercus urophasianus]